MHLEAALITPEQRTEWAKGDWTLYRVTPKHRWREGKVEQICWNEIFNRPGLARVCSTITVVND